MVLMFKEIASKERRACDKIRPIMLSPKIRTATLEGTGSLRIRQNNRVQLSGKKTERDRERLFVGGGERRVLLLEVAWVYE